MRPDKGGAAHREGRPRQPRPLDEAHLRRQTLGDAALAAELLELFARQASQLLHTLKAGPSAAEVAVLAHALVGAARAVGAVQVARAAEAAAAASEAGTAWPKAIPALAEAIGAALAAIPARSAG